MDPPYEFIDDDDAVVEAGLVTGSATCGGAGFSGCGSTLTGASATAGFGAGGVPDVISDGEDGLLVPFDNAEATAAAIGRLLADRELARRLGAAGHAKVLREYTWGRIYAQVRAIYAELGV